jgi:hypothetical protein
MKSYSNDPQDYTLEDYYSDAFDSVGMEARSSDLQDYFNMFPQAFDLYRDWSIARAVAEHDDVFFEE